MDLCHSCVTFSSICHASVTRYFLFEMLETMIVTALENFHTCLQGTKKYLFKINYRFLHYSAGNCPSNSMQSKSTMQILSCSSISQYFSLLFIPLCREYVGLHSGENLSPFHCVFVQLQWKFNYPGRFNKGGREGIR